MGGKKDERLGIMASDFAKRLTLDETIDRLTRPSALDKAIASASGTSLVDKALAGVSKGSLLDRAARGESLLAASIPKLSGVRDFDRRAAEAMRLIQSGGVGGPLSTILDSPFQSLMGKGRPDIGKMASGVDFEAMSPSMARAVEQAYKKLAEPVDYGANSQIGRAIAFIERDMFGMSKWMRSADLFSQHSKQASRLDGIAKYIHGHREEYDRFARSMMTFDEAMRPLREAVGSIAPTDPTALGLKMSVFAGAITMDGATSGLGQAAIESILGGWRMREDLPRGYGTDPQVRLRVYREAEVDPELLDADNREVVHTLIDSGVVEGRKSRKGAITAVVEAGPVSLSITARSPTLGAYRAIDAIEIALRGVVAAKLEAAAGTGWFKQRTPGAILAEAKRKQDAARRNREPFAELIHFVDLGDLIHIMSRADNWPLFEPIFGNREELAVDLGRLTANRRAAAHARRVDPVRLAELVFVISRLNAAIRSDGIWDSAWDEDR